MATKIEKTDTAKVAIYEKINTIADEKQNKLTFDTTPKSGSSNPVTSGGIYSAIPKIKVVDTLPDSPDSNTFYFIKASS